MAHTALKHGVNENQRASERLIVPELKHPGKKVISRLQTSRQQCDGLKLKRFEK
jgi:hypothetical protein